MQLQTKQVRGKTIQLYPEAFKRSVIEEYLKGGICKMDLLRKYGIKTKSGIQRWMKRYGYPDTPRQVSLTFGHISAPVEMKKVNITNLSQEELQAKVHQLERQLLEEKLRSEAYQRMLQKAEEELKLPIRKKFNTR